MTDLGNGHGGDVAVICVRIHVTGISDFIPQSVPFSEPPPHLA